VKRVKAFIRYLSLVIAVIVASLALYRQLSEYFVEWQQRKVLGTTDTRGFEQAQVAKVIDGDTIELIDGRKVRYIGVDTPETKHPTQGQECFGTQASQKNTELVAGKIIQLEKDVNETDRYGRLLRYVWLDDQLVNKQLVAEGYAFARSFPPDIKRQVELQQAEQQARLDNKGLWSSCPLTNVTELQNIIDQADEQVLGATDPQEQQQLQPEGCVIKGNISENGKLYHLPSCSSYGATQIDTNKGERWFCSEPEAQQSGWVKATGCN
jgi:micrococcal nuclease